MGRGVFKLHPSRHTNRSFECDLLSPHPFINSAQRLLLLSPESPVLISILFSPPLSLSLSGGVQCRDSSSSRSNRPAGMNPVHVFLLALCNLSGLWPSGAGEIGDLLHNHWFITTSCLLKLH